MTEEYQINDPELGLITVRHSNRLRRYKLIVKQGAIIANLPATGNEHTLLQFIETNRQRLLAAIKRSPKPIIWDETTQLSFTTFRMRICRHKLPRFQLYLKDDELLIGCPQDTRFEEEQTQQTLRRLLKAALRHEAKRCLPTRLNALALQHGFHYKGVAIKDMTSRWGSCSSRKQINLSLLLMTLPWHLIDYVLLHELCHTVELNHGERFWALMDQVTNGKALQLRKELKGFRNLL
ncbi:MAG: M48 family metallopeptidase [Parabacteroides sp.]